MKTQSIAAKTGVGAVDLGVTDGDRALRFYRDYVGLTPLASMGSEIRLGAAGRDPIDLEEMFSHLREDDRLDAPMPEGTKMGHIHLHVADVEDALRFYHDLVGFDVMGHVPGVGFVSAGGYHHHVGLNTWAGQGAQPAPPGSAGLRRYAIELPTQRDLDDVIGRLEHGDVSLAEEADGLAATDPSANRVLFRVA